MSQSELVDAVTQVVRRAWRRVVFIRSSTAFVWVMCALVACFALLLLAGLDVIGWQWLCFLTLLSAGTAAFIVARRLPTRYQVAQEIDIRCGLHDSLSTAWHLQERNIQSRVALRQRQQAAEVAEGVDLGAALPLRAGKPYWALVSLVVVVCGLLAARYSREEHLDLHPSFLALWRPTLPTAANDLPSSPPVPAKRQPTDTRTEHADANQRIPEGAPGADPTAAPQTSSESAATAEKGFFERMRDVVSNLLDRFKPNPTAESATAENREQNGNASAKASENSNQRADAKQKQGGEGQQSEGQQSGERKEASSNAEGNRQSQAKSQSGENGSAQSAANESKGNGNSPQSSAGNENGSKHIANAAELKAMGKIEQILGKRAAQVSGDVSEVTSNEPQQLTTQFTGRGGEHQDTDSSVMNEPVARENREFLRKYMDEMHRITEKQSK